MSICEWLGRKAGALVSILLMPAAFSEAPAAAQPTAQTTIQTVAVPAGLCRDFAKRLDRMTGEQVSLISTVPASARVWSRCTVLLRDDIVAGQKCVSDGCAEVDKDGIVERVAGSIHDRLSSCARAAIDLVRLTRSFDLLSTSYSKVCQSVARPVGPR